MDNSCHIPGRGSVLHLATLLAVLFSSTVRAEDETKSDAENLLAFKSTIFDDPMGVVRTWSMGSSKPPCDWEGVECDIKEKANGERVIQVLDLTEKKIKATLWKEIGKLKFVRHLRLSKNRLFGHLIEELGSMYLLETLDLSDNQVTGEVPASLSYLSSFTTLILGGNNMQGDFPALACDCSSIRIIDLSRNNMTGTLTPGIGKCSNLEILMLNNNHLHGAIPKKELQSLTNLRTLNLAQNKFSGSLPSSLTSLTYLTYLNISKNNISGDLPSGLSNIYFIQTLDLSGNILGGMLPKALGDLTSLEKLDLSRNKFFGVIPPELGLLTSFAGTLNLSNNRLTGIIPTSIGNMQFIKEIDLSHNNLWGHFPNTLGGCKGLVLLDVSNNLLNGSLTDHFDNFSAPVQLNFSYNQFTGGLPRDLGQLDTLQIIDFSHNNLTDPLPRSLDGLEDLKVLDVSNNKITGPVPAYNSLKNLVIFDISGNNMSGILPDTILIRKFLAKGFFNDTMQLCGPLLNKTCPRPSTTDKLLVPLSISFVVVIILATMGTTVYLLYARMYQPRFCVECIDWLDVLFSFLLSPIQPPWRISVAALQQGTHHFHNDKLLGTGGHYKVYRADLADGMVVAVKVVHKELYLETRTYFLQNCKDLARLKHPNILKILDWRCGRKFLAIVVEYMSNGPLEDYVWNKKHMGWKHRLKVAVTTAAGLAFLHQKQDKSRFVQCFVWPRKILLDQDYVAHLSGLHFIEEVANGYRDSFIIPSGFSGYMAPECSTGSTFTVQAEVYSYGITLLELTTRKRAASEPLGMGFSLPSVVRKLFPHRIKPLVHSAILRTTKNSDQVISLIEVALCCTEDDPSKRPSMETVVLMLDRVSLIVGCQASE